MFTRPKIKKAVRLLAVLACGLAIAASVGAISPAGADELPSAGSGLLGGQSGNAAPGTPRAEVAEPVYDFGKAPSGPPINHVFMVKNSGNGPLQIRNVTSSCGCTAAKPSKSILAPGEVSTVAASVDTKFERGHSLSVVTLTTNDPVHPALQLKIQGVIQPQVVAQPIDVQFGRIRKGIGASREVVVSDTTGGGGFAVSSVKNESPYIKVTQAPHSNGKQEVILHVALLPTMPPGPISDTLKIETSRAPVRVAVLGVVTGDLLVNPDQVSFGILPHHEGAERIVRLTNQGKRAINVLGVDSTNHSVYARVDPVTPGKDYKLRIALRPNTPDGQIRGALTVRTDDPQQATLTIPYYGIVGSFRS
jgi:Protein of unknown function (DUF1573)